MTVMTNARLLIFYTAIIATTSFNTQTNILYPINNFITITNAFTTTNGNRIISRHNHRHNHHHGVHNIKDSLYHTNNLKEAKKIISSDTEKNKYQNSLDVSHDDDINHQTTSNFRRIFLSSPFIGLMTGGISHLKSVYAAETSEPSVTIEDEKQPKEQQQQQQQKQHTSRRNSPAVLKIDTLFKPNPEICQKIQTRSDDLIEFYYEAYIGNDDTGIMFDSSNVRLGNQPYAYVLGSGDIIPGVDQALYDMCLDEVRAVTIPPALGFGASGTKLFRIPPYTNLYWKITLVSINFIRSNDSRTREDLE